MKTICDWNNCFELGEYRAPIEKDNSNTHMTIFLEIMNISNKKEN